MAIRSAMVSALPFCRFLTAQGPPAGRRLLLWPKPIASGRYVAGGCPCRSGSGDSPSAKRVIPETRDERISFGRREAGIMTEDVAGGERSDAEREARALRRFAR